MIIYILNDDIHEYARYLYIIYIIFLFLYILIHNHVRVENGKRTVIIHVYINPEVVFKSILSMDSLFSTQLTLQMTNE